MVTNYMVKKNIRQYVAQIPIPDYGASLIKRSSDEIHKQVRQIRHRIFLTYATPALAGSALIVAGAAALWGNSSHRHDLPGTTSTSFSSSQTESDTSLPPPKVDLPVYISDTLRPSYSSDMLHLRIIKELDIPDEDRYFLVWDEKAYLFQAEIIHAFYTSKEPRPPFPFPENGMTIDCVVFGETEAAVVRETEECFALITSHTSIEDRWTGTEPQSRLLYQLAVGDVDFMPISNGKLSLNNSLEFCWKWFSWEHYMRDPYLCEDNSLFLSDGEDIASVYEKLTWLYEEYYPNEDLSKREPYSCFHFDP